MSKDFYGIVTDRIYFREEIAEMWGRDGDQLEEGALRRWWSDNFKKRGLKTMRIGHKEVVHGRILSAWIEFNSKAMGDER